MAHKTYVFDTSTLINDPKCFTNFKDNTIIIPISVLEELDHIKSRSDNAGAHARAAIRYLDSITESGDIQNGINIGDDTIVKMDVTKRLEEKFSAGKEDDYILSCAFYHKNSILVSKDINMRLRARAFGIIAQDYKADKVSVSELYMGHREVNLGDLDFSESVNPACGFEIQPNSVFSKLHSNEFVKVTHNGNNSIMRKTSDGYMSPVRIPEKVWGLKSKNMEQAYALDLLLDSNVPLVTLTGLAGTGKTIVTVSAALEQVIESRKYTNVQFYRPIISTGKDIGFLPGTLKEKIDPWMGAVKDAICFLTGKNYEDFIDLFGKKVSMESISYIRGRSFNNSLIVIDEAQNASKSEIKTIITRVGFGSKIVLLGDIEQIDNVYLDSMDNGLTYVIEKFKDSYLSGHVTLVKGERSKLATEAASIL